MLIKAGRQNVGAVGMIGLYDILKAMFEPRKLSLDKKKVIYDALSCICADLKQQIKEEEKPQISWDSFVLNILLEGKVSQEDIRELMLRHVGTSDGRVFGQCENCHKYAEEKKVGDGFDANLHLCYDWENERMLCPACIKSSGVVKEG